MGEHQVFECDQCGKSGRDGSQFLGFGPLPQKHLCQNCQILIIKNWAKDRIWPSECRTCHGRKTVDGDRWVVEPEYGRSGEKEQHPCTVCSIDSPYRKEEK